MLAAIAAFGVLALGSATASATTTLRLDPGNTAWSGALQISNTASDPAVLTTHLGTVTCSNTAFLADVAAATSAGSISGTLTTLISFTCTDTIAPVNITGCLLHDPSTPAVTITGTSSAGGTVLVGQAVVRCSIQNSTSACYYSAATAAGTANNATNSITFPTVTATTVRPTTDALTSGLCGQATRFSVTLTHIVQSGTGKTATVRN